MTIAAVLFDLDGTFADTALDLHAALDHVMRMEGLQSPSYELARSSASHGSLAMLRAGFGEELEPPRLHRLKQTFLNHYRDHLCDRTRLFDGIEDLLERLDAWGIRWGIVTNKPSIYTEPLMSGLGVAHRAACIVSGDTTERAKPDPEPILHACRQLSIQPEQALYVGDAERDIEAGRRAGTRTLIACFGYLAEHDQPEQWCADGMIDHPLEIIDWLERMKLEAS